MLAEHFVYHLAALEERERLAQDLHDHVAQDLVYLKIKAILVGKLLEKGEIDRAQAQLQELQDISSALCTGVRERVNSLRTEVFSKSDSLDRLREYLDKL